MLSHIVGNKLVLAVMWVTKIMAGDGCLLESTSKKHFAEPGITLLGQLLELEHKSDVWYRTWRYDLTVSTTLTAHQKHRFGFDFASHFALPVNPTLIEQHWEHVWGFNQAEIHALMEELWAICADNSLDDHILFYEPSVLFPYHKDSRLSKYTSILGLMH